ncbi:MAG TPA: hypothetical protein VJB93_00690 [Patescibacteria group bacterium]|nr:hypothetical protein [Patescibacteria group bacterium]
MNSSCEHVQHLAELLYTRMSVFHPFTPFTAMDLAAFFPEDGIAGISTHNADTWKISLRDDPEVTAWCVVADALFPASKERP